MIIINYNNNTIIVIIINNNNNNGKVIIIIIMSCPALMYSLDLVRRPGIRQADTRDLKNFTKLFEIMLQKMPLQPGFLHCQLAYEPDKTGYLAGWMHTMSLALPLRTRLDGTALN